MKLMHNEIRSYAWGSRTALADLLGEPGPSPGPQAELWIGAHPNGSSVIVDEPATSLAHLIALDPCGTVGAQAYAMFGARLPFLLKVLAAEEPLSLQAHPSAESAREGFAREEARGLPLSAPDRNYRDGSHKPELICALTPFDALCGFRDPRITLSLLTGLGVPELDRYSAILAHQPDAAGLRALFSTFISMHPSTLRGLLTVVLAACGEKSTPGGPFAAEYRTVQQLAERYPADPGVLISLLLNRLTLMPGQALYLPAGNLHAYLSGVGVEIMANSDNVLRGGLTTKHVDIPELMTVLDFSPIVVSVMSGNPSGRGELVYQTPAPEFRLSRLDLDGQERDITHSGAQVVLAIDGQVGVTDVKGEWVALSRGQSLWIPANDQSVRITGDGTVFRATDGLAA